MAGTTREPPSPSRDADLGLGAAVVDSLLVLAFFFSLAGPFLLKHARSAVPGGWDGVCHYAATELYSRELFPRVSGFLPDYFAGMPFPNFYPPLFYVVVSAFAKLGVGVPRAFFFVQLASCAAVPLLLLAIGKRLTGRRIGGLVAGCLGAIFMVSDNVVAGFGVSLEATFNIGLTAQHLSFVFFLAFLLAELDSHRSVRAAACKALFLAAVPLSNVHVVWDAIFLFAAFSAVRLVQAPSWRARRVVLARDLVTGSLGVLVAACWVLPMLGALDYVPTLAMSPPPAGALVFGYFRVGIYSLFAIVLAWSRRDAPIFAIIAAMFLAVIFGGFPLTQTLGLSNAAIQPGRVLVVILYLGALLVAYVICALREVWAWRYAEPALAAGCVLAFLVYTPITRHTRGVVAEAAVANYRTLFAAANEAGLGGRGIAEMGEEAGGDAFTAQCLLGTTGIPSLTAVYRESAITALFTPPLRNTLGGRPERFGVDGKILDERTDIVVTPEATRARFALFGVRHFFLRTPEAIARVEAAFDVTERTYAGRWRALSHRMPGFELAAIPERSPVLTFADFSVKRRPDEGYDFVRLGEEMFVAGRFDVPLVLSQSGLIDREPGLDRFHTLLLTEYRYASIDGALETLLGFAERGTVIALASEDPLYRRLASALASPRGAGKKIALVPRASAPAGDTHQARFARTASTVAALLEAARGADVGRSERDVRVVSAELGREHTVVRLSRAPTEPVPVLIKQSYFPSWATTDGAPIYMASPTFDLVFATKQELRLELTSPWVERVSALFSLLAAVALLVGVAWSRIPWPRWLARLFEDPRPLRESCDEDAH